MVTIEVLTAAITDVEAKQAKARADHQALQQQAIAINAQGVEIEKAILGLDGELKALMTLREAANG